MFDGDLARWFVDLCDFAVYEGAFLTQRRANADRDHHQSSRSNAAAQIHGRILNWYDNVEHLKVTRFQLLSYLVVGPMALHFLYYDFVRVHKTLRITPAMAAGVTDRLWEMSDMVEVLEAWEANQCG